MAPPRRFLKANKGTEAPSSLLFFDAECHKHVSPRNPDLSRLSLRLWCAIWCRLEGGKVTRRQRVTGKTAAEFWAAVEGQQDAARPLWAFAHNLGFDLTQLQFWERLESREYKLEANDLQLNRDGTPRKRQWRGKLVLNARPTFMFLQGTRGRVKFVDTGNYWPRSLYKIGKAHGLPKGTFPGFDGPDDELEAYCYRDCEVIELAVCQLIKRWTDERCGVFQASAPSLAMTNWRHTAKRLSPGSEKLPVEIRAGSPARSTEREGYFGPWIQPFFLGTHAGPIYHFDCNSLFPAVMAAAPSPCALVGPLRDPTPDALRRRMHAFGAVATVLIDSRTDTYPVRLDGVQQHARGRFLTTLCGAELANALNRGHVAGVTAAYLYRMADLFGGWVKTWYARKLAAKRAGEAGAGDLEFAKLILNSLYGKWAQRGDHWQDDPSVTPREGYTQWAGPHPVTRQPCHFRSIAGYAQTKIEGGEARDAMPIISAHVTAAAREYMKGVFAKLPRNSLLYSAMDSLFLTEPGAAALEAAGLVHGEDLGKFRLENTYFEVEIRGPGWYRCDDRWVRTGVYGSTPVYENGKRYFEMWQSLSSVLGHRPDGSTIIYRCQEKHSDTTLKGTVDLHGWVHPLTLEIDPRHTDPIPTKRGPAEQESDTSESAEARN